MSTPNEKAETWETQEVIRHLINDEDCWNTLKNKKAYLIRRYVIEEHSAPEGLYESFSMPPRSKWSSVDWEAVAESLAEEE